MTDRIGSRREARETALGLLYQAEARGDRPAAVLAEQPLPPAPYVATLVSGVDEHSARIDEVLTFHADGWAVGRMPMVDRLLLRIGTFELLTQDDVPVGAILSEAVELAQSYSTEPSSRFINGVLNAVAEEVR